MENKKQTNKEKSLLEDSKYNVSIVNVKKDIFKTLIYVFFALAVVVTMHYLDLNENLNFNFRGYKFF